MTQTTDAPIKDLMAKIIDTLPDGHKVSFEIDRKNQGTRDLVSMVEIGTTDDLKALVQRLEQAESDRLAYMKYVHGVASLDFSSVPIEFHSAVVRIGNELQAYLKECEAKSQINAL